jgi:hypothetical protein
MFWVAQLDPASLSLWYDTTLIIRSEGGRSLVEAAHFAVTSDFESLGQLVSSVSEESAVRCLAVASTIWHEQRHFLDLVLTSYGGMRFRQFSSIYVNQTRLLRELKDAPEPRICPIDAYADPIRLFPAVAAPPDGLATLGRDVRKREDDLEFDRFKVADTWRGQVEVGGHGQLEALAYLFQLGCVEEKFGLAASLKVQQLLERLQGKMEGYRWPLTYAHYLGLRQEQAEDGSVKALASSIPAILVAALATRGLGQTVPDDPFKRPAWPASRLYAFIEYFDKHPGALANTSPVETWTRMNEIAAVLFGRTVLEELQEDQQRVRAHLDQVREANVSADVCHALEEFSGLREALLLLLEEAPEMIIDPYTYSESLSGAVRPFPVQVFPSGYAGEPLPGWQTLLGYKNMADVDDEPNADVDDEPNEWVWAVVPEEWSEDQGFTLAGESWLGIIRERAPLARLMIKGRAHETAFGPQLIALEKRLESVGIGLSIEGGFGTPVELMASAAPLFDLIGAEELICDICRGSVGRDHCTIFSPWWFRQNNKTATMMMHLLGGGERGTVRAIRDWSAWLICDSCSERLVFAVNH